MSRTRVKCARIWFKKVVWKLGTSFISLARSKPARVVATLSARRARRLDVFGFVQVGLGQKINECIDVACPRQPPESRPQRESGSEGVRIESGSENRVRESGSQGVRAWSSIPTRLLSGSPPLRGPALRSGTRKTAIGRHRLDQLEARDALTAYFPSLSHLCSSLNTRTRNSYAPVYIPPSGSSSAKTPRCTSSRTR